MKQLIETFRQAQEEVEAISHTPENIEPINILLTQAAPAAGKVVAAITAMIGIESTLPATAERKAALKLMADSRGSFALGLANIRAYLLSGDIKFKNNFDKRWRVNSARLEQLSSNSSLFSNKQLSAWNERHCKRSRSKYI